MASIIISVFLPSDVIATLECSMRFHVSHEECVHFVIFYNRIIAFVRLDHISPNTSIHIGVVPWVRVQKADLKVGDCRFNPFNR